MFLPVRDLAEILSPPLYFKKEQKDETVRRIFNRCQTSTAYTGTALTDPLCSAIMLNCFPLLVENVNFNDVEDYVDSTVQTLSDIGIVVTRYDCVTALNRLQGIIKEDSILMKYDCFPSAVLKTKIFEEGFIIRGRLDAITRTGIPVEIKSRTKKMYFTIPRNEYIQCALYAMIYDTPRVQFIQAYQTVTRSKMINFDEEFYTELKDNILAVTSVFQQCIENSVVPTHEMMPEFDWSVPLFIKVQNWVTR